MSIWSGWISESIWTCGARESKLVVLGYPFPDFFLLFNGVSFLDLLRNYLEIPISGARMFGSYWDDLLSCESAILLLIPVKWSTCLVFTSLTVSPINLRNRIGILVCVLQWFFFSFSLLILCIFLALKSNNFVQIICKPSHTLSL